MTGGNRIRSFLLAAGFVAAYVLLDKVSFIHALTPLNITPWNPAMGLAFAALVLRGPKVAPLILTAIVSADVLVRDVPASLVLMVGSAAFITAVYMAAAHLLRRGSDFHPGLMRLRDVFLLTAVSVMAALVAAVGYVGIFQSAGMLRPDQAVQAVARFWIGDMIGIAVVVPLILVHRQSRPKLPNGPVAAEALAQGAAILGSLWIVFGFDDPSFEFRLFYLLFLPMIWIGARFCLEGATIGNLVAQIGLIVGFEVLGHPSSTVTTFQYLMLALASASLFLGAAVNERRRIEAVLRLRQDELAQFSRLSMAGEMAAALAHELNQPLLATIAFTRAAQRMFKSQPPAVDKAEIALDRAVAEAQRAGEIVRTLREFIGTGATSGMPESLADVVADALALVAADAARRQIRLVTAVDKLLPAVHVDRVQVQQVILNLLRNAMDAMGDATPTSPREIAVSAGAIDGQFVEVEVRDSGPGVSDEVAERLFAPFNTSKASGMGLGLSISRGIIEANGGRLWLADNGPRGAAFRFSLPISGVRANQASGEK